MFLPEYWFWKCLVGSCVNWETGVIRGGWGGRKDVSGEVGGGSWELSWAVKLMALFSLGHFSLNAFGNLDGYLPFLVHFLLIWLARQVWKVRHIFIHWVFASQIPSIILNVAATFFDMNLPGGSDSAITSSATVYTFICILYPLCMIPAAPLHILFPDQHYTLSDIHIP